MAGGKLKDALKDEGLSDRSTLSLIAANLFAAAIAVAFKLSLRDMLLVYWVQSVVIGLSFFIRMLSVQRYAVLGPDPHNPQYLVTEDGASGGKTFHAVMFLLIFIVVHAVYLGVLTGFGTRAGTHIGTGLVLCGLVFAVNHIYALARSIRLDRGGIANLSMMTFLPWLRVVPMQAVIFLGVQLSGGTAVMLLFIGLKTAVDVLVEIMEHHEWRRQGPPAVPNALRGSEPPRPW